MYNQANKKSVPHTIFSCWFVALATVVFLSFFITVKPAQAETRSLKLYYVHTNERAEIVFKKNGRYIDGGLKKLNYFLRDWRRNEPTKMDPRLFDLIWQVYRASGSRDYIHVISAYRSPKTNNMLRSRSASSGVAKNSQHTLGKAMDFYLPDVNLSRLRQVGLKQQVGGVGYYPKSGSPFVHMDVGRVRHWPRMSRKELMALFPDGKTMHIPADGKPLARYEQAVAEYNARKGSPVSVVVASNDTREKSGGLLSLFGRKKNRNSDTVQTAAARAPAVEAEPKEDQIAELPDSGVPVPAVSPIRVEPQLQEEDDDDEVGTVIAEAQQIIPVPEVKPQFDTAVPLANTELALNRKINARQGVVPGLSHKDDAIAATIAQSGVQTAFVQDNNRSEARDEVNAIIAKNDVIPLPEEDIYGDDGGNYVALPDDEISGEAARSDFHVASINRAPLKAADGLKRGPLPSPVIASKNGEQNSNANGSDSHSVVQTEHTTRTAPTSDKSQGEDLSALISQDRAENEAHIAASEEIRQIPELVFASGLQKSANKPQFAKLTGKAINFRAVARTGNMY